MTHIFFVKRQEHQMEIEVLGGESVAAVVAGLNTGVYELRNDNQAVVETGSGRVVADISSIEATAAGVERIEFTAEP